MEVSDVLRLSLLVQYTNANPSTFSDAWENWHVCITHGSSINNLYLRDVAPGDPLELNILCSTNTWITVPTRCNSRWVSSTDYHIHSYQWKHDTCAVRSVAIHGASSALPYCKSMILHSNRVSGVKLLPIRTDSPICPLELWCTIVLLV
jgi:hypothetical protein